MSRSQILIQQLSFNLVNNQPLFHQVDISFAANKIGLIGKNGVGKSTLLKLILGELIPLAGKILIEGKINYFPQDFSFYAHQSIAEFLAIDKKLAALERIAAGSVDPHDYEILDEDWLVAERYRSHLQNFGLESLSFDRSLGTLSGGELTRLFLIQAFNSQADFILLDEPTNNLDAQARAQLYEWIKGWEKGLIIVSHDRTLLNLMDEIIELSSLGFKSYGGNFDHYAEQKHIEKTAAAEMLQARKEILAKGQRISQLRKERHEQNQAKGRRERAAQIKAKGSYDKIEMNSAKGRSEKTNRRIRLQADRKLEQLENELKQAKDKIEISNEIKIDLPVTYVPPKKVILEIENLNFRYPQTEKLILANFNLQLKGADRIALVGDNGSGKTTLLKLILGKLIPQQGQIHVYTELLSYLDQKTDLLDSNRTILENFQSLNPEIEEQDAYWSLSQFLFRNTAALKHVNQLSGGERIRAALACTLMAKHPPQLLILDEPTNHLDLHSIESIESALRNYQGCLLVVSHDQSFLANIGVKKRFLLDIPG